MKHTMLSLFEFVWLLKFVFEIPQEQSVYIKTVLEECF